MNTGQTMLTVLALGLLSFITMTYYGTIGQTGRTLSQTNAAFIATTVATSVLEEIDNCAYDAYTDSTTAEIDSSRFTSPGALGREAGEAAGDWKHFDDIDDFNGEVIAYTPGWMNEVYSVEVQVYYVNPWGDIDVKISGATAKATYMKRVDLKVWRSYPPIDTTDAQFHTVRVSNLHGYYFFSPI